MGTQNDLRMKNLWKLLTVALIAGSLAACSSSSTDEGSELGATEEFGDFAEAGTDEVPEDSFEEFGEDLPEGDALSGGFEEPALPEGESFGGEGFEEPAAPMGDEFGTGTDQFAMEEAPMMEQAPMMEEPAPAMDAPYEAPEMAMDNSMDMSQPAMNEFGAESASMSGGFAGSGSYESYSVRRGDTLMKIAFEYYGDLYQWKRIYEANRDKITDPNVIPAGTVLNIERPATAIAIDRNGERYRIKQGDTLGSISTEVYGTSSKWRKLWDNNRQLIKDPNQIYAGFDLYYQPEAGFEAPQQMAAPESMPMNDFSQDQGGVEAVVDEANVDPGIQPDMRMPANQ